MSWTDHTWVTGETITAALLNGLRDDFRFLHDQGADLVAAATIAPTIGFHKVTGNTQINNITPPAGSSSMKLVLWFTGTPILKHLNGGTGQINTHSFGDYLVSASEVLVFQYDTVGQTWYEVGARSPIFVGAQAYHDVAQTTTSTVPFTVAFNQEDYDFGGLHSPSVNNSRMTIPNPGKYTVDVYIPWADNGAAAAVHKLKWTSGASVKYLRYVIGANINSNPGDAENLDNAVETHLPPWQFAAGDFLEVEILQRSGGNRDLSGRAIGANPALGVMFSVQKVG